MPGPLENCLQPNSSLAEIKVLADEHPIPHSFTFFAPIFGVLAGVIFLNEEFTSSLMVGLPIVCVRILLVNWRKRNR